MQWKCTAERTDGSFRTLVVIVCQLVVPGVPNNVGVVGIIGTGWLTSVRLREGVMESVMVVRWGEMCQTCRVVVMLKSEKFSYR